MPDRTLMDRYLDRVLRCLEAEEKADKETTKIIGAAEVAPRRRRKPGTRLPVSASRKKGVARLMLPTSLNIEPEVDYVAFLHDVVFALQSQ